MGSMVLEMPLTSPISSLQEQEATHHHEQHPVAHRRDSRRSRASTVTSTTAGTCPTRTGTMTAARPALFERSRPALAGSRSGRGQGRC